MYDKGLGDFDWGAIIGSVVQGAVTVKTAQSNAALQQKQIELQQAQAAAQQRAMLQTYPTSTGVPGYSLNVPQLPARNTGAVSYQYNAQGQLVATPSTASNMTMPLVIGGAALLVVLFMFMKRR
jgi:hypothetical protein